jgi:hypothetical protein
MNISKTRTRCFQVVLGLALGMISLSQQASAQSYPNTVTFANGTGEDATVKLVGPDKQYIQVRTADSTTVHVPPGDYFIVVRYGRPGHYSYSKGDHFSVTQIGNSYSVIQITLHKIVNGNYRTRESNQGEFDSH